MNTSLKNDAKSSSVPVKSGTYVTTNLYRTSADVINAESTLMGLGQTLNKFETPREVPVAPVGPAVNRNTMYLEADTTRISRSCNLPGVTINRFDFPFVDQQQFAIHDETQRGGFHTRNNEKDTYERKCL